ncbi:GNAT family N-acetyltransferase [Streptomyces sp. SCL15-4]|uniref:GNAT family N-acetyltransferase n=1 Tax=Streptomyces sp. SCL15-4 TaxID=2967221 RepID=UPI0029663F22|nr:GNAT family N-acetyltransferase [Streptomyces sp. SCL15-4]
MNDLIRGITEADWPRLAALESEAYADLSLAEGEDLLRSRARASAGTCFVLEHDGLLAGYVLALPYPRFRCPALGSPEQAVHDTANLHLHDIVVSAPLRRRGLGTRLVRHLTATAAARGFTTLSLVAVGDKEPFWRAHGYRAHPSATVPPEYGRDAVYMSAPVTTSVRPDREAV